MFHSHTMAPTAATSAEPVAEIVADADNVVQNAPTAEAVKATQGGNTASQGSSPAKTFTILGFKLSLLQLILLLAVLGFLAYYGFKKYKSSHAGPVVATLQPVA